MRVLVAMSGGVDSSVAAARLLSQGHQVVGVTLHLWDYPDDTAQKSRCCAPEDIHDAARVAAHLGFPHYAFDRRELFNERVVLPFVDEYVAGTTPSPCVTCNQTIKFAELIRIAARLGCEQLATGHYARVVVTDGRYELHRGLDTAKDQSYFLYALTAEQLEKLCFPLGESQNQRCELRPFRSVCPVPPRAKVRNSVSCKPGITTRSSQSARELEFVRGESCRAMVACWENTRACINLHSVSGKISALQRANERM